MKYLLDASGLFYYHGNTVSLTRKADPVLRYLVYHDVESLKPLPVKGKKCHFHEGDYLVVEMKENFDRDTWGEEDRRYFQYVDGVFVERHFPKRSIMEGELELAMQLGLVPKDHNI